MEKVGSEAANSVRVPAGMSPHAQPTAGAGEGSGEQGRGVDAPVPHNSVAGMQCCHVGTLRQLRRALYQAGARRHRLCPSVAPALPLGAHPGTLLASAVLLAGVKRRWGHRVSAQVVSEAAVAGGGDGGGAGNAGGGGGTNRRVLAAQFYHLVAQLQGCTGAAGRGRVCTCRQWLAAGRKQREKEP